MSTDVQFEDLHGADLVIDRVYKGGKRGNSSDDPISKLVPGVGNMGGFRASESTRKNALRLIVLYTSGEEPEWPDALDHYSGLFTYYGDNRKPGVDLHERKGNAMLRYAFDNAYSDGTRVNVPPILLFEKTGIGRDVRFKGLAVPGALGIVPGDDLVAVWRSSGDQRFQNYRALFTILAEGRVSNNWLKDVSAGNVLSNDCPKAWRQWVQSGKRIPLITRRVGIRNRGDQLPTSALATNMLETIHNYFASDPFAFEACAVDIWRIIAPNTGEVQLTRRWRDGGRDAIGSYMFGPLSDRLLVDFALEAKAYKSTNGVGVKEMSRLISRLKHRQFGVFVTTSFYLSQTYKEVRSDQHPVVLISGRDIVDSLRHIGIHDMKTLERWLQQYPVVPSKRGKQRR